MGDLEYLQSELEVIDAKLNYLLKRGSNDEKLVNEKREIQLQIEQLKKEK